MPICEEKSATSQRYASLKVAKLFITEPGAVAHLNKNLCKSNRLGSLLCPPLSYFEEAIAAYVVTQLGLPTSRAVVDVGLVL